jgi:hypothetical protein
MAPKTRPDLLADLRRRAGRDPVARFLDRLLRQGRRAASGASTSGDRADVSDSTKEKSRDSTPR